MALGRFRRIERVFIVLLGCGLLMLLIGPGSEETSSRSVARLSMKQPAKTERELSDAVKAITAKVSQTQSRGNTDDEQLPLVRTTHRRADDDDVLKQNEYGARAQETQTEETQQQQGPGEMGVAVQIDRNALTEAEKSEFDAGWSNHQFNLYLSDRISLHRSLPDLRHPACKDLHFVDPLPTVSVIIIFHNEARSTLLRTVHSVLDRSPPRTVKEVILVDDASDAADLQQPLEAYVDQLASVRIVRSPTREGLIRARLLGARHATADILVFLDSHCECYPGWLEPLIDPIARNWSVVTVPVIKSIDDSTLGLDHTVSTNVGTFDWKLDFHWRMPSDSALRERKSPTDPIRSPVMAGGLFAISRAYFDHLGTYDDGMQIWGAENLEISFRIWMCGGLLYLETCSIVGHIFRKRSPYKWPTGFGVLRRNKMRVAEVWLDEYKENFYDEIGREQMEYGDVSARRQLRQRLNCSSFEWYMKHLFPEFPSPNEAEALGEIRSQAAAYCLQAGITVQIRPCYGNSRNKYFLLSKNAEILHGLNCVDRVEESQLKLLPCHAMKGNQEWIYQQDDTMLHPGSSKCIELSSDNKKLIMAPCDASKQRQRWSWKRRRPAENQTLQA